MMEWANALVSSSGTTLIISICMRKYRLLPVTSI
jgi:hypothetical protein